MYDFTELLNKKNILNDKKFTRLVSYPRTGSHWLRVLLEKYTGDTCFVRGFYDKSPKNFWGFHVHNREINKFEPSEGVVDNLEKVIYLYREPCDTIFSLLKYEKIIKEAWKGKVDDMIEEKTIQYAHEYQKHLERWKINNSDVGQMLLINYNDLKNNPEETFKKIVLFLNYEWNGKKFNTTYNETNKQSIKKVTLHDNSVIHNEEINYKEITQIQRKIYKNKFKTKIYQIIGDCYDS